MEKELKLKFKEAFDKVPDNFTMNDFFEQFGNAEFTGSMGIEMGKFLLQRCFWDEEVNKYTKFEKTTADSMAKLFSKADALAHDFNNVNSDKTNEIKADLAAISKRLTHFATNEHKEFANVYPDYDLDLKFEKVTADNPRALGERIFIKFNVTASASIQ